MFGHESWGKFRKTALCLGFEAMFFFVRFFLLVFLTCGDIRYFHIVSAEDQLIKFGEKSSSLGTEILNDKRILVIFLGGVVNKKMLVFTFP